MGCLVSVGASFCHLQTCMHAKKGKMDNSLVAGYFLFVQIPTRTTAMMMAIPMPTIGIVLSIGCGYSGAAVGAGASATPMAVSA